MLGVLLGASTLLLTLALERLHPEETARVESPLYRKAWQRNMLNSGVLGPLAWEVVTRHMCGDPASAGAAAAEAAALVLLHAVGYYGAHRAMHHRKLFRIHKLHHRFSDCVVPVAANCVSGAEYVCAYMAPFALACAVVRPAELSLFVAASAVSVGNLCDHCPRLRSAWTPWWWVSPRDHLEHHRGGGHYAAPTFNIDALLVPRSKNSLLHFLQEGVATPSTTSAARA
jgi:sterol desaturase/sphingolipid hydroxylase (fatty acid hydroxylase superfamily)